MINNNVKAVCGAVGALVNDAETLAKAGTEGRLAVRADLGKHAGEYRKVIHGINASLDAFLHAQKLEAVGQLAGGIAHDFNNLLQIINGYSSLILESTAEESPLGQKAQAICHAGERAAQLTRQLLAFSRKQIANPSIIETDCAIAALEKMLRRLIGENVDFRTSLGAGGAYIRIDPSQLDQVIMNLVVNARDAMPFGGRLTIETKRRNLQDPYPHPAGNLAPGAYVVLVVSDTGHGMDAATRERIFEPFFTTKAPGKGTGLGLSTVCGIVRQCGGAVHVSSAPGTGSTFTIYLPLFQDAARESSSTPPQPAPTGTETVLLAEDEDVVRILIRDLLHGLGYRVLLAPDGKQAFALAEQHLDEINIVISDTIMPAMGGLDLYRRLRTLRPGLKVVLMTGYADGMLQDSEIQAAGLQLLSKPFTRQTLARKLREVLDA